MAREESRCRHMGYSSISGKGSFIERAVAFAIVFFDCYYKFDTYCTDSTQNGRYSVGPCVISCKMFVK